MLLLWSNGRIAGISGISGGLFGAPSGDRLWRLLFVAGLMLGALLWVLISGHRLEIQPQAGIGLTLLGGVLVGYGTRLGHGCTSGHGVCGLSRRSPRSLAGSADVHVHRRAHRLRHPPSPGSHAMSRYLTVLLSSILFGLGLAISTMVNPARSSASSTSPATGTRR